MQHILASDRDSMHSMLGSGSTFDRMSIGGGGGLGTVLLLMLRSCGCVWRQGDKLDEKEEETL